MRSSSSVGVYSGLPLVEHEACDLTCLSVGEAVVSKYIYERRLLDESLSTKRQPAIRLICADGWAA